MSRREKETNTSVYLDMFSCPTEQISICLWSQKVMLTNIHIMSLINISLNLNGPRLTLGTKIKVFGIQTHVQLNYKLSQRASLVLTAGGAIGAAVVDQKIGNFPPIFFWNNFH